VIMNLFLIPRYGAFGCCVSALCSQVLLGIATMTSVHKKLKTIVNKRSLILYFAHGALLLAGLYGLLKLPVSPGFLLAIVVLVTLLFMSFSKMISLNNWRSFVKKQ